jgi:hypothetical protein
VAYLDLTLQGTMGLTAWVPPRVWINGVFTQASFGRQMLSVPAGPVRIDINAQWLTTFGHAQMQLDLPPGQTVPVFYAMPWTQFQQGAIGHTPQTRPGLGLMLGLMIPVFLLSGFSILISLVV